MADEKSKELTSEEALRERNGELAAMLEEKDQHIRKLSAELAFEREDRRAAEAGEERPVAPKSTSTSDKK